MAPSPHSFQALTNSSRSPGPCSIPVLPKGGFGPVREPFRRRTGKDARPYRLPGRVVPPGCHCAVTRPTLSRPIEAQRGHAVVVIGDRCAPVDRRARRSNRHADLVRRELSARVEPPVTHVERRPRQLKRLGRHQVHPLDAACRESVAEQSRPAGADWARSAGGRRARPCAPLTRRYRGSCRWGNSPCAARSTSSSDIGWSSRSSRSPPSQLRDHGSLAHDRQ